jgi:hypothetical protein
MSLPSKRILAQRGLVEPVSMLKNVVLPAPFGPMMDTIDCCGMKKSDAADGGQAAEPLRHALGAEQRVVGHAGLRP